MQYILQHVLVVPSRYLSNKNEEPDRLILYVKVESENGFLSSLILTKLLSNPANGNLG